MVEGLYTIWCQVSDMDRSVAFYRDVLGLKLEHASPFWSSFDLGNGRLGLHPALAGQTPPHGAYGKGWFVGLKVANIAGLRVKLELAGAAIHGDYHDIPGGVVLDFSDPDGNVLEAFQSGVAASELATVAGTASR
jgi:predicted enzyme related to lactoylglutathione lyase